MSEDVEEMREKRHLTAVVILNGLVQGRSLVELDLRQNGYDLINRAFDLAEGAMEVSRNRSLPKG